jgi:glycerol-3-phosphate dehydrogenase (NAD(P)+)
MGSERVTVIGDGAMGILSSTLLAQNGHAVRLWGAFAADIEALRGSRRSPRRLPDAALPASVELTAEDAACFKGAGLVISAVPTQFLRSVWTRLAPQFPDGAATIISVTKGIENETLLRPSEVIEQSLRAGGKRPAALVVLSGPNIAGEIARGLPATAVAACSDETQAARVQAAFTRPSYRVYTNSDVVGVELSGAMKNVIALAAGMVDGLGLGHNAKAALVTRGLVEIARLGRALGASDATFSGLSGLGDLITTCMSPEGRNRSTGEALAKGRKLSEILASTASVVEGVATTRSVIALARSRGVEMPITEAVHRILFEEIAPQQALAQLMARQQRAEV